MIMHNMHCISVQVVLVTGGDTTGIREALSSTEVSIQSQTVMINKSQIKRYESKKTFRLPFTPMTACWIGGWWRAGSFLLEVTDCERHLFPMVPASATAFSSPVASPAASHQSCCGIQSPRVGLMLVTVASLLSADTYMQLLLSHHQSLIHIV